MIMTPETVLRRLEQAGAFRRGHFVLASGRHAAEYIDKSLVTARPRLLRWFCRQIALVAHDCGWDPAVVVAPAVAGIALAQWVAYELDGLDSDDVLALYADKDGDGFTLVGRGYDRLVAGKKVLVVEDILTTGGSARRIVEVVRRAGGDVVGVAALVNRGGVTAADVGFAADIGFANSPPLNQLFALADLQLVTHPAGDCPLCRHDIPINTDVGHGREYLATRSLQDRINGDT
jgi:orotate phosphoribosyltransferase